MKAVRDLEIIKSALEESITRQKKNGNKNIPAFIAWLEDSETVLKKVCEKLAEEKAKELIRKMFLEQGS